MTLSWNEIKDRALNFSKEWAGTSNEEADAKPFLVEFFNVFGISSKRVSTFEHRVKKLDEKDGYIDLLWKGTILIEMKSLGKNLTKAYQQAIDYTHGLKQHELPKYILVSDFENFRLYDLEEDKTIEFKLNELVNNVQHFGYLLGYQKKVYKEQDPANIKAAELMGKLHDSIEEIGYTGHHLEVYLVRILFLLFAEDTTIFNKQQFQDYIEQRTSEDGSDLAAKLQELFQVLNTPKENRFKNLDEQLSEFPYVNGKLFEEILPTASFDAKMRQALLNCCYIDWSKISPAIFGSMFQSVMNPQERRNLGAHYTSETNILKLIKPLFLDDLWKEFESIKDNKNKLPEFHRKLSTLKFLDPACGCGNFLVITYRELRLLELEILRVIYKGGQQVLDVSSIMLLDVDMMYGIEYEEFPARIAEVAMWLIDHQMNMLISNEFGQYFVRLPLKKSAKIVHGNALQIDWENLVSKNELSYILGNPPFIGKSNQNENQKKDLEKIFVGVKGAGIMDYVAGWYLKAAQLIQNTKTKVAFVSTNSITQGEQVGILWNLLFNHYKIKIHFAHRTFNWSNEAKANAAVHVVIIGFANYDTTNKSIFEYEDIKGEAHEIKVKNINPYLVEGKDFAVLSRTKPICNVPEMLYGNKIVDGGFYLFTETEKLEFLKKEPNAEKFFKPILSGDEFINGRNRWVLYLANAEPQEIRNLPLVKERVESVVRYREASTKIQTRQTSLTPQLFAEPRQPDSDFLLFPRTSSENRRYLPLGFFTNDYIVNDSCIALPNASIYHFGMLSSTMHMSWVRYLCGRLKSDYRYSNSIVYNNFPWPEFPNEKHIQAIKIAAQRVLETRSQYPKSSLADLYDPMTMPPALVKAHNELDKAVDLAYRPQPFTNEAKRMEFLFELYEKYTADLFTQPKGKKKKTN
ncbi:class I SAM-dependent DNA methyltransferase [Aquirufa aurantiipilula]|uniref:class I SAM-dependent DNA methyltransferase n=1 Tax=Aquirufa aurantiipilula TaxID=2696561 RepID=UPI001CAA45AA|nr:DNA methyltransferase [Aquirufa aurantiipilula]MBZ1325622.1 class I SAM-dependent DNA methyltransferase [Aquirufa aurantiipilula]